MRGLFAVQRPVIWDQAVTRLYKLILSRLIKLEPRSINRTASRSSQNGMGLGSSTPVKVRAQDILGAAWPLEP